MAAPKKNTAVALKPSTTISTETQDAFAAEMERFKNKIAVSTGDKIKVDNHIFTLPNGDTSDVLTGVIVDFVHTFSYYTGTYDPKNIVPPDCFAIADESSNAVPSDNSPDKQSESCAKCWANAFGSAPNGSGKACKNGVRIALLPVDADESTPLMTLDVSPTALKPFNSYLASATRVLQRPPFGFATDFACDPNVKYDTLRFGNPVALPEKVVLLVMSRREEAARRLAIEPDVSALLNAANDAKPAGKSKLPAARGRKVG